MFIWLWVKAHSQKLAVQCGFPGETSTWWVSLTFLSLAIKIFSLYAAACTTGWCLPPQNTSEINLLEKTSCRKWSPPASADRLLPPLLTAMYVCPRPGAALGFLQIKTSALPQGKKHFNGVLEDLLHFPLKFELTQGWGLLWKSRSKKMMPLLWRLIKQLGGCVKVPAPLTNVDWDSSEENVYIMCCGWGGVEMQAGFSHAYCRCCVLLCF